MLEQQQLVKLIKEREAAFFVGSGISFDPPSMLPSWIDIAKGAIRSLCSDTLESEQEELLSRSKNIRPEVLLDIMYGVIGDKSIEILNVLNSEHFNINHAFLAFSILDSNISVITTNYDELIELAAARMFGRVISHIYYDENGFNRWLSLDRKPASLFKLHGTISDKQSIRAALRKVAAGPSKAMSELLKYFFENYEVIFWGYSLTNDFDIVPILLRNLQHKGIIWLRHGGNLIPEQQEEIQKELEKEEKELEEDIDRLIKGGLSAKERETIQKKSYDRRKKVNYMRLFLQAKHFEVETFSSQFFIPIWKKLAEEKTSRQIGQFFSQWGSDIGEVERLLIGAEIFFYLREEREPWRKVIDLCDRVISILSVPSDYPNSHEKLIKTNYVENDGFLKITYPEKLSHAYFLKGWAHRLMGYKEDNEMAIRSFEQAENILNRFKELSPELLHRKSEILHQKGIVYQRVKNYNSALQCLNEALKIRRELRDRADIAFTEFQIFMVNEDMGKYMEGYLSKDIKSLEDTLSRAQEELHERGDIRRENIVRHNIAFIHQRLGTKNAEHGYFKEAREQLTKEAIERYIKTIGERRLIFDVGMIAMAKHRLSECYKELASISSKLGEHERALSEIKEAREHLMEASGIYNRVGDLYRQELVEKTKKSIDELERKIEKYQKTNCV